MLDELGLDEAQMGQAVSAFFWVYALAQVPAGRLADRWGSRNALALYMIVWSSAMVGLALAGSLASLIAMRVALGLGQAGAYPSAAACLKRWMPLTARGVASGSVSMGGRGGGLLAHLVTPQLMLLAGAALGLATGQWRAVFCLYAAMGVVWAVLFWRWFRNTPREHPQCNAAEIALIEANAPSVAASAVNHSTRPQWRALLTSRNLWLLCTINFVENVGWIFLVTWLPTYLKNMHEQSLVEAGSLTSLTGLAGMAGCLCGGLATDRLVRSFGLVWGRRLPAAGAMSIAAVCYVGCLVIEDVALLIAVMAAIYFLHDMALASIWSTYQDIGGAHVATVLGFTNMCGNLGAAMFAWIIGYLAREERWETVFIVSAASFTVTAVCWMFVDPRVTVDGGA
jgi:ACS family glucarate transporter-like MFS transporter